MNYPTLKVAVGEWVDENLNNMSAKRLREELINKILPDFIKNEDLDFPPLSEDDQHEDTPVQRMLVSCGIQALCEKTCREMLHYLGATYGYNKKSFYTNNHEKYIAERINYVWNYLEVYEPCFPVFVSLPVSAVQKLKEDGKLAKEFQGYTYEKDEEQFQEFHMDCCDEFFDILMDLPLMARYSVKCDPNDRILPMGHDEASVHQNDRSKKGWKGTKGQFAIWPKGRGKLIMMSGVLSKAFLWDPEVSEMQLREINYLRRNEKYIDAEAAIEVLGDATKPELSRETLPFLKFIEPGANSGGFWTGAHMHLQLEDLADCCKVMWPGLKPMLFTDWSQGHARKRPDGLDVMRMNKGYGGAQVQSRESILTKDCFGSFDQNVGMLPVPGPGGSITQSFTFHENDAGPCWMSPAEQAQCKYDREIPGKTEKVYLKINELKARLKDFQSNGGLIPAANGQWSTRTLPMLQRIDDMTKAQLVQLSKDLMVPHYDEIPKVEKGWVGQPKGLLQILFETGWVDGKKYTGKDLYKAYSLGGKKDAKGDVIPGTNLLELMEKRDDFANEMTMMQWVGSKCGITVVMSPKCHCEIAGESIEMVWGIGKVRQRQVPLSARKDLESFRGLVRKIWSRESIGRRELRGSFRMHRSYILAYYYIHGKQTDDEKGEQEVDLTIVPDAKAALSNGSAIDYATIQKKMAEYKSHLCIMETMGKTIRTLSEQND